MSPKNIKKLAEKKYRTETGLFLVEGEKNIKELLLSDFEIVSLIGTTYFVDSILDALNRYEEVTGNRIDLSEAKAEELARMGSFVTNEAGIAVVRQKEIVLREVVLEAARANIVLLLDDVRDPGNLGTIIRIADWYGVSNIVASPTTTDFYNPKTISATKGSFTRVSVLYEALDSYLALAEREKLPVVVADMEGESTHTASLPKNGFLLMGSESHGIHEQFSRAATHRVTIPRFGGAESLNVSVATGILLDSLRRP